VPDASLREQAEQLEAMAKGCENIGLQADFLRHFLEVSMSSNIIQHHPGSWACLNMFNNV
jgi:hypothetical protein